MGQAEKRALRPNRGENDAALIVMHNLDRLAQQNEHERNDDSQHDNTGEHDRLSPVATGCENLDETPNPVCDHLEYARLLTDFSP